MRHSLGILAFSLCCLCASQSYAKSVCENKCASGSGQVFHGIEYCHKEDSTHQIFILKVDLQAKGIRPFVTPNLNGSLMKTSKFVSKYGVQVGINTAFFAISSTKKARGYQKSDGSAYTDGDQSRKTMGFDKQNHYLQGQTDDIRNLMYNATSGSHFLLKDGKKVDNGNGDFSKTTHPRTAVGIDQTGRYFYMLVVDGRRSKRVGMSLSAMSDCMLALGAYNSINMDGGGSSTMVIKGKGVVNSPSDGSERSVAVHLGFFANKDCTPSEEICNNVDDDCDGEVDEDQICEIGDEIMYQAATYHPQNTDIDGDGKADICARGKAGVYCTFSNSEAPNEYKLTVELTNDSGWDDVSNYATIQFADINGDGLADLCARANAGVICWPSNGNGFGDAMPTIPMSDEDGYDHVKYYSTIRFADINGDGRDDMCARFKDGFKCYPSAEAGWGEAIALGDMDDSNGWDKPEYYATIRMADVNGDGKADVCGRGSAGFRCWLSEGDKFADDFTAAEWSDDKGWNKPEYYATIRMADINGDHKADICARNAEKLVCHLSQGTSMDAEIAGPDLPDADGWNDYDNYSTLRFGDFNGDGKEDACIRANAAMLCYPSNGNGFDSQFEIADMSNENGWNKPDQFRTIRMGDIDGDKKMEVCGRNADMIKCYQFNGTGFDAKDGPAMANSSGWDKTIYYPSLRLGGPLAKPCSFQSEACDQMDNNCNGEVDEGNACCVPSEEICDQKDNDCDGQIDEDNVCCVPSEEICDGIDNDCDGQIDEDDVCTPDPEECTPSKEICDQKDNDCDGKIDEDGVCDTDPEECTPSEEICDGIDNDCDGKVDEGCNASEKSNNSAESDCTAHPRSSSSNAPHAALSMLLLGGLALLRRRRSK